MIQIFINLKINIWKPNKKFMGIGSRQLANEGCLP